MGCGSSKENTSDFETYTSDVIGERLPEQMLAKKKQVESLLAAEKHGHAEGLTRSLLLEMENKFGLTHGHTLHVLGLLAQSVGRQGRFVEAEGMMRRATDGYQRSFGAEHPLTLMAVDSLALCLKNQGKAQEAEPMTRRFLEGIEKVHGPDHSLCAQAANNLGMNLASQNRLDEAEPLLLRAYRTREKLYGTKHQATLSAGENLAATLDRLGKHAEAEPYYRRALAAREAQFGPLDDGHPTTTMLVLLLVCNLSKQQQSDEAEALLGRVVKGFGKSFGLSHPNVRKLEGLLGKLKAEGRLDQTDFVAAPAA